MSLGHLDNIFRANIILKGSTPKDVATNLLFSGVVSLGESIVLPLNRSLVGEVNQSVDLLVRGLNTGNVV